MSGLIQMTPVELRDRARRYQESGMDIERILTNLRNLQDDLRQEWKGAAFREFDNQFIQLDPKVQEFSQLMHAIYKQLVETANAVEDQDKLLARNFGLS